MKIRWPALIMLGLVVLGVLILGNILSQPERPATARSTAPQASPTEDAFCADAVERVKAYKAPGQRDTVDDLVTVGILADPRPHQLGAWRPARRAGDFCQVMYSANIGNAPAVFIWDYTPATGRVETNDGDTKRLLGWR